MTVSLNSRARLPRTSCSSSTPAWICRDASLICNACAVSTTSFEVSPEVQPAGGVRRAGRGELLGHGGGKGDHVMADFGFDFLNALGVEVGVLSQSFGGFLGDFADLG